MDLLSSCTSGGCGAKLGPGELSGVLQGLSGAKDPRLLVGFDARDDAAVYQLSDDEAIVSTVDFFSPMVDDPALFGRIAAANALSDLYAMGAAPLFALNMVCFPERMDKAILREILCGGAEKLREAGCALAGGHSIYDHEIKYGLSATGRIDPARVLRNGGCQPGDCLILTKPLGVGVVLAAHRVDLAAATDYAAATESMQRLNRDAAEAASSFPINACTDVTGFGLLAHLLEMTGSTVTAEIDPARLPLLPGAYGYAEEYLLTAAGQRNRNFVEAQIPPGLLEAVPFPLQELMLDPQTSGGLLFSLPEADASAFLRTLCDIQPQAQIIGTILPRNTSPITFVKG